MPIVDHLVIEPPHPQIVEAVLEAILGRHHLRLVLESSGVDRPWIRRREIHANVHQLVMLEGGWLAVGGRPPADSLSDWHSIHLHIWNGDGVPLRPWQSWEDELLDQIETTESVIDVPLATAALVTR